MRKYLLCVMTVIMVVFVAAFVYAQDEASKSPAKDTQSPPASVAPAPAPAATPAPEVVKVSELSIYGEVQNINMQASSMTVQYYDYDNDEENGSVVSRRAEHPAAGVCAAANAGRRPHTLKSKTADFGKTTVRSFNMVEVVGFEPTSEKVSAETTTSVS